jgi:hypothetical protein
MSKIDSTQQLDVSNARDRQMELLKLEDKIAAHFLYWFSWFWAISSVLYFFCVTFLSVPASGKDFAMIILGFLLGTAVATIIGYFFGNSKD